MEKAAVISSSFTLDDVVIKYRPLVQKRLDEITRKNPKFGIYWEFDIMSAGLMAIVEAYNSWRGDYANEPGLVKHIKITINHRIIDCLRVLLSLKRGESAYKVRRTNPLDLAVSMEWEPTYSAKKSKNPNTYASGMKKNSGFKSIGFIDPAFYCKCPNYEDLELPGSMFNELVNGYDDHDFITILGAMVTEGLTMQEAAEPFGLDPSSVSIKLARFCEWVKQSHLDKIHWDVKTVQKRIVSVLGEIRFEYQKALERQEE